MAVFHLSAFADEADKMLQGQIEALHENGIAQVELRGVDGKNISTLTTGEAEAVRRSLDENGIRVSSIGSPYGKIQITDDFDAHKELFEKNLTLAEILGADCIRMFSFYYPQGADPAAYRDEVLRRLDIMCTLAAKKGIQLLHENEKGIYGDTDDRCLDLLTHFEGRLLGVFDPANFIQCGVNTLEAMEKLSGHIAYMHIKDALREDGSVVPCGKGDGNVAQLLKCMSKRALHMTLSLEPHLKVFDGLGDLQDEEVKHKYVFENNRAAFKAAADALKDTLRGIGFAEVEGSNGKWML